MKFDIDLAYKKDTGASASHVEINVYSRQGEICIIDEAYELLRKTTANDGACFLIPDPQYIEWLESKVEEYLKSQTK